MTNTLLREHERLPLQEAAARLPAEQEANRRMALDLIRTDLQVTLSEGGYAQLLHADTGSELPYLLSFIDAEGKLQQYGLFHDEYYSLAELFCNRLLTWGTHELFGEELDASSECLVALPYAKNNGKNKLRIVVEIITKDAPQDYEFMFDSAEIRAQVYSLLMMMLCENSTENPVTVSSIFSLLTKYGYFYDGA